MEFGDYSVDEFSIYKPFMTTRALSMTWNSETVSFLNQTVNVNGYMKESDMHFKFLSVCFPENERGFRYISNKNKKKPATSAEITQKEALDAEIEMYANTLCISPREVREYIDRFGIDIMPKKGERDKATRKRL